MGLSNYPIKIISPITTAELTGYWPGQTYCNQIVSKSVYASCLKPAKVVFFSKKKTSHVHENIELLIYFLLYEKLLRKIKKSVFNQFIVLSNKEF